MAQNVSELLLQLLIDAGVKRIYGVTGDALNVFVRAIEDSDKMDWIACKHEENAAFAAFGESITTGTLGVCAATVGPGALHLVNGLYNAKKERTPVLAITGQVDQKLRGTNYFQEVDLKKVFDDICSFQAIIRTPEEAPQIILKAMQIAISQKTVCRIEVSADIAGMEAEAKELLHKVFHSDSTLVPGHGSVQRAADAINDARKICILAGDGCRNARAAVTNFARKIKAPIAHSLKASDIFDHDMPDVVGLSGLIGNPSGYNAIMKCDLLIMLGTDFPYVEFLPHDTKTIQVDVRPENIGNRTSVEIGVHADIQAFLDQVMNLVHEKTEDDFREKHTNAFKKWRKSKAEEADPSRDYQPLHPQIFFSMINQHAAEDGIFTVETGTAAIWAAHHISFHSERRMIGSFNHGSMAVGLPAAIGAQLANPGREVWALCGDGSFNMSMQDFITAVKYNLPLKVLVLNNAELSFVKLEMEEAGLTPALDALHQENMNFADYARLCGGDGVRVEAADQIEAAILAAKASDKPFIIDAVVNSGELSLPPHIGFKEVFGFGSSKVKEGVQIITGDKDQWNNLVKEIKSYFD